MKLLRQTLEKQVDISDDEWDLISSKFKAKSVSKGEIVHHAGEICNYIWYIKSGLARAFFIDSNGKEFTWQLYYHDESLTNINLFMDDSVSFYEQSVSLLSFEILEDSQFEVISANDMDMLFDMEIKWQRLGRKMIHEVWFASTYKRLISLMTETVEQRYQRLLSEYPGIFKKVKSYHIASYLGIAPQTLSKLRKNESR